MMTRRLAASRITEWVSDMVTHGNRVVGPTRRNGVLLFSAVKDASELEIGGELPRKSPKGLFFPQTEIVFRYRKESGKFVIESTEPRIPPTVLIGVYPCDASSGDIMDHVFGGRYNDRFYQERREKTTIITLSCPGPLDDACFCSALGLGPDSRRGADVFSRLMPNGDLVFEAGTPKGEALLSASPMMEEEAAVLPAQAASREPAFDPARVKGWLDKHFDDPFWSEETLRCLGCGTCTYLCPVCHCFDIVDEPHQNEGVRRKNWDSCQLGLFTRHASGHNPRGTQAERFRQRVMHKFKYYVDNNGVPLCVGCGRCVRSCPAGQSLLGVLMKIDQRAKEEAHV